MLSGRGLCDELITRPEESYRLWCVIVCDLETSRMGAPYIYIYDISRLRVNLEQISDGIQPSFIRNLIIMHCSTLTLPSLHSSSSQLTILRSSKHQVAECPWNSASTLHILLLSVDRAAFLNYEQIIIHICPRLVLKLVLKM